MVIQKPSLYILLVVYTLCSAWPGRAGHVPAHPIDAQPCGQIEGQPDAELGYCLWPGPAPLLVLLSALGNDARSWSRAFVSDLNGFAGVLVYDRRDYDQGVAAGQPVTAETIATDLQALLRGLAIDQPVVLIGHALGGLYAQYVARLYPREVAAVVLIETTSPLAPIDDPRLWAPEPVVRSATMSLGSEAITRAIMETREAPAFPPIPLLVLSAAGQRASDVERAWQQIQAQTAAQSPLGRQVLIRGGGLEFQDQQPALVAAQIEKLWRELQGPR
jgi:pimeloyl-ACP methyl ester carboxylesterase